MKYVVTTFYKFLELDEADLKTLKSKLYKKAQELELIGLVLIASEGVNATMAGEAAVIKEYKVFLREMFGELRFKDGVSHKRPFKRFKVKIKPEIVQLRRQDLRPSGQEKKLKPEDWDKLLETEDAVLIDVRNWYETKIGKFPGAIDPKTLKFSQFPKKLSKLGVKPNQKIGIYCTGGIRCEKAALAMEEQGFSNVWQLEGGILGYLEARKKQSKYDGECFVFDHRASVKQDLSASEKYDVCWVCGNAGGLEATCEVCETQYRNCRECKQSLGADWCSKRCRNQ